MTIEEIEFQLSEVSQNYNVRNVDILREHLIRHKRVFVAQDNQVAAKKVWCLEQVINVQEKYKEAFEGLAKGQFYTAWCDFERVEIEYSILHRHFAILPPGYQLDFILSKTHQWQSLYPYGLFLSLEFFKRTRKCTICDQIVSLRNPCGHLIGEIYEGEMCCHEITVCDNLSVSLVTHPHHKYAVAFPKGDEPNSNINGKYNNLIHTKEQLSSPFDEWRTHFGKRIAPMTECKEMPPDSRCPCGSMEDFNKCCFDKQEILIPWVHVTFGEGQDTIPDFLLQDDLNNAV